MSTSDAPITRKEMYLNAIATGDASGIPETPYTREEMYLDAIAKGGGGGGGSADAALVVVATVEGTTSTLNKTWQEIDAGNYIAVRRRDDGIQEFITRIAAGKTGFSVTAGETTYECAEGTDYPSYTGK